MNYINRALVKQQAKDIIKGKIFYLFLVSAVVLLLTNMSFGFNVSFNINKPNTDINDFDFFNENKGGYNNFYDYYSDFGDEFSEDSDEYDYEDNPIEDFEFEGAASSAEITPLSVAENSGINAFLGGLISRGIGGSISYLIGIVFMPLFVTMIGMYLSLVRRSPDEPFELGKELSGIFKNSFNETYLKKLLVILLKNVLALLLLLLFIVPGIIFLLSSFFAEEIMSDNPNLKPTEAIKLSKKMVAGNRTELFTLVLSFIPWYLLTAVTFGIASIYVLPYFYTTKALYYENFRMRALQNGRITPDDFKSFDEKFSGFTGSSQAYSYTAPSAGASGYYYAPPQKNNNQPSAGSCYYNADQAANTAPTSVNTDAQAESYAENNSESIAADTIEEVQTEAVSSESVTTEQAEASNEENK